MITFSDLKYYWEENMQNLRSMMDKTINWVTDKGILAKKEPFDGLPFMNVDLQTYQYLVDMTLDLIIYEWVYTGKCNDMTFEEARVDSKMLAKAKEAIEREIKLRYQGR